MLVVTQPAVAACVSCTFDCVVLGERTVCGSFGHVSLTAALEHHGLQDCKHCQRCGRGEVSLEADLNEFQPTHPKSTPQSILAVKGALCFVSNTQRAGPLHAVNAIMLVLPLSPTHVPSEEVAFH